MESVIEKQAKRWTYEEYYKLDDDQRYEIMDGELIMVPAPDMSHQHGLGKIYVLFHQHVASHNAGLVFFAPVDVVLDSENVVQPDIVFVSTANLRIIEHRAIFGAPDLLMEMLSPSSLRRDLHDKKALYARHGVKEYWIGDQSKKTVEILTLRGGRYQRHCAATGKGKLVSKVLPGLELELADILSDL